MMILNQIIWNPIQNNANTTGYNDFACDDHSGFSSEITLFSDF